MKGLRPRDYLQMIQEAIRGPQRTYTHEEVGVAEWLRGDEAKLRSIIDLFLCRIERRALSPAPSTEDKAEFWARDRELRELIVWLVDLHSAPADLPTGEDR